jgi:regulator of cell morphogenesis and NO signaling
MMMIEHERVGELLTRLRTVTDAYQPPKDACFSYRELYRRLNFFEATTHEHSHVENNI